MLILLFFTVSFSSTHSCPDTNCESCEESSCVKCFDGYYLASSSCVPCDSNCLTCTPDFKCLTCQEGYLLSQGACIECPLACSKCIEGKCSGCSEFSNQYNEFCCGQGVAICSWEEVFQCQDGYLFTGSSCVECPETCFPCLSGICNYEPSGSVVNPASRGLGQCITVPHCDECRARSCDVCSRWYCRNLYKVLSSVKYNCVLCQTGCTDMMLSKYCVKCKPGYILRNYVCCPVGCLKCTPGLTCPMCSTRVNEQPICSICAPDYYLENGKCYPNCRVPGCSKCDLPNHCSICSNGFYLDKSTPPNCRRCFKTCSMCSSSSTCTGCNTDYYLYSGHCCPAGCISCDENSVCIKCADGYIKVLEKCQLLCADANCKLCFVTKHCQSCKDGYYLVDGTCAPCYNTCKTCTAAEVCVSCIIGYSLHDSLCCKAGCLSCSLTKCLHCISGFYLLNDNCFPCSIKNCLNCVNLNECRICTNGYYLINGICFPCSPNCASCTTRFCYICKPGYDLVMGKCCKPKCRSCNQGKCLECESGWKALGQYCVLV